MGIQTEAFVVMELENTGGENAEGFPNDAALRFSVCEFVRPAGQPDRNVFMEGVTTGRLDVAIGRDFAARVICTQGRVPKPLWREGADPLISDEANVPIKSVRLFVCEVAWDNEYLLKCRVSSVLRTAVIEPHAAAAQRLAAAREALGDDSESELDWGAALRPCKRRRSDIHCPLFDEDSDTQPFFDLEEELGLLSGDDVPEGEDEVEWSDSASSVAASAPESAQSDDESAVSQLSVEEDPSPPLPLPAPPEVPPAAIAAPRQARSVPWGPAAFKWTIAEVWDNKKNKVLGWGAQCGCHTDVDDVNNTICKKQLRMCDIMPPQEARTRIKLWLLAGCDIDRNLPHGRLEHRAVNPRELVLEDDPEEEDEEEGGRRRRRIEEDGRG